MRRVMQWFVPIGSSAPAYIGNGEVVGVSPPAAPGGSAQVWTLEDDSEPMPTNMVQAFMTGVALPMNADEYVGSVSPEGGVTSWHIFTMLPYGTIRPSRRLRLWRVVDTGSEH